MSENFFDDDFDSSAMTPVTGVTIFSGKGVQDILNQTFTGTRVSGPASSERRNNDPASTPAAHNSKVSTAGGAMKDDNSTQSGARSTGSARIPQWDEFNIPSDIASTHNHMWAYYLDKRFKSFCKQPAGSNLAWAAKGNNILKLATKDTPDVTTVTREWEEVTSEGKTRIHKQTLVATDKGTGQPSCIASSETSEVDP